MRAQLENRRLRLLRGERAIGWKVGFGAPAATSRLGISGPLVGFLTDAVVVQNRGIVDISGWTRPVAEPEVAVQIGTDLFDGNDRNLVGAAISGLGPAIELADIDVPPDDVETILAGNIYNRRVVFGATDPARIGGRLDGLSAVVLADGEEVASTTDIDALTGDLVDVVGHVAGLLKDAGQRLRAGDVVIAGSIVPPLEVTAGTEVTFRLSPIPAVSVRLT